MSPQDDDNKPKGTPNFNLRGLPPFNTAQLERQEAVRREAATSAAVAEANPDAVAQLERMAKFKMLCEEKLTALSEDLNKQVGRSSRFSFSGAGRANTMAKMTQDLRLIDKALKDIGTARKPSEIHRILTVDMKPNAVTSELQDALDPHGELMKQALEITREGRRSTSASSPYRG